MSRTKLLSRKSKNIEHELVGFYRTVGEMVSLNSKATEIFAYLRIYDTLTQEQLRRLTGFSPGTISTTLQLFLETDIVSRQFLSGTHKNLYSIKPERVNFVYTPSTQIIENLERFDLFIIEKQSKLQELKNAYPVETEFLHLRLNSIRNYIEAQRRQINKTKKQTFLQEDVSELIPLNEVVVYPFDTQELEEGLIDVLGHFKNDPIKSRIMSIFFTHRSVDQQTLMEISNFSRSTISRFLQQEVKGAYVRTLPREYRRPRIYYLDSASMSILSVILNTDNFIYSYIPRLREILSTLQSENQPDGDTAFLLAKIEEIIEMIETFRKETRFLRQAYKELAKFLGKKTLRDEE